MSQKKIWIDIDNSPHVPFFLPIIEELQRRGHEVLLTARDSYQVCELLRFHQLPCKVIGSHWGKNLTFKTMGTLMRAARLMSTAIKEKPNLAMSLLSRAQLLACSALGIPTIMSFDYEFVMKMQFLHPDWILVPELIPDSKAGFARKGILRYPGLKEDVYVPRFKPDARMKKQLGIDETELLVTLRPPATEAHYHNPESEKLSHAALDFLMQQPNLRVVLLPRNDRQTTALRWKWGGWIAKGKMVIPKHVVDGLNLIWFSDLVISGGGTMNREAAALGVPVYSIFRGQIGAVDKYLAQNGRLVILESVEDVRTKIALTRHSVSRPRPSNSNTLDFIVDTLDHLMDCPRRRASDGHKPIIGAETIAARAESGYVRGRDREPSAGLIR